jgi:CSLREA domain-containing protein
LIGLSLLAGAFPCAAVADTFTINTGADTAPNGCDEVTSGGCTLREAVLAANANTEADVIEVTQDVTLSRTGSETGLGAVNDLDVIGGAADDLTIRGIGAQRTVNAASIDRVIQASDLDLTLENLAITGGRGGLTDADPTGGGIEFDAFSAGEKLRLDHVAVGNNTAATASGSGFALGGGVAASDGVVEIVNGSNIHDNAAGGVATNSDGEGGGVSVDGTDVSLTVSDSTIANNKAGAGPFTNLTGSGGGIRFRPDSATTASFPLTITNTAITDNRAGGLGSVGNGDNGGGVYAASASSAEPQVSITGGSVSRNHAGGGSGNATGFGGGINTFDFLSGIHGSLSLDGVTLDVNTAGGNDGITNGTGQGQGGAVYNQYQLGVTGSHFNGNLAGSGDTGEVVGIGGAIIADSPEPVTISSTEFTGNSAGLGSANSNSAGGAAALFGQAQLSISGSTFIDNATTGIGGALTRFRDFNGEDQVSGSSFTGNTAGLIGGAIDLTTNDGFRVSGSLLAGNDAGTRGGAISAGSAAALEQGSLTVENSTISANHAFGLAGRGGGLYIGAAQPIDTSISFSTIAGNNTGANGRGGNLFTDTNPSDPATLHFRGSIVTGGSSTSNSENCDLSADTTVISDGGNVEGPPSVTTHCGLDDLTDDLADPLLAGLAPNGGPTATRALPVGSPAVDNVPLALCTGFAVDQRGYPRPSVAGGACDSGAYELFVCNGAILNAPGAFPGCPPPSTGGGGGGGGAGGGGSAATGQRAAALKKCKKKRGKKRKKCRKKAKLLPV